MNKESPGRPNTSDSKDGLSTKKAKLSTTANVSNKKIPYTLEFDTDEIPAQGSAAMFDAIFKAAKRGGTVTSQDLAELKEKQKHFWAKPEKSKKGRENKPKKEKPHKKSSTSTTKAKRDDLPNDPTADLLAQVDALINSQPDDEDEIIVDDSTVASSFKPPDLTLHDSNQDSDDDSANEQASREVLGSLLFFQICLKGKSYSIRIHEKKKIREVREMLAKKFGCPPECLTLFFGDDVTLEDEQTVHEAGLYNLADVDACYTEQSLKNLYLSGNKDILQFKLQSADRRGRDTVFVYARKTEPMLKVRDQYANEMGIDPSQIRLVFDGDAIDLDLVPEECDLEGDECIDVIIR